MLFGNLHVIEVYSNGFIVMAEKVQPYVKSGYLKNGIVSLLSKQIIWEGT